MGKSTTADGARALKISEDEVAAVRDADEGLIVTTTDGVQYIVVDKGRPDANGRHGVMFLVPPTPRYRGDFPVFCQAPPGLGAPGPMIQTDVGLIPRSGAANIPDPSTPADPGTVVPEGNESVVLKWVGKDATRARQAAGYERTKPQPRSALIRKLDSLART